MASIVEAVSIPVTRSTGQQYISAIQCWTKSSKGFRLHFLISIFSIVVHYYCCSRSLSLVLAEINHSFKALFPVKSSLTGVTCVQRGTLWANIVFCLPQAIVFLKLLCSHRRQLRSCVFQLFTSYYIYSYLHLVSIISSSRNDRIPFLNNCSMYETGFE